MFACVHLSVSYLQKIHASIIKQMIILILMNMYTDYLIYNTIKRISGHKRKTNTKFSMTPHTIRTINISFIEGLPEHH